MSTTLSFFDHLLEQGNTLQEQGRAHDASKLFNRIADMNRLPKTVAAEAQAHLADLHYQQHRFDQARRHLGTAIGLRPANAEYHYHMAQIIAVDEDGDAELALNHYERSLEINPNQPPCLSDYGLFRILLGDETEGLVALREAYEMAPDDAEIVGSLLEGLLESDQPEEASRYLREALFRNPRSNAFQKLWSDFRFQLLQAEQQKRSERVVSGSTVKNHRMVLPFLRPVSDAESMSPAKVTRQDDAELLQPLQELPRPPRVSKRRQA